MGFSCTIKAGKDDLTKELINYKLFGLAPSHPEDTEAPYDLSDFRHAVSNCIYGDKLKAAAIDCFNLLRVMALANKESLKPCHCDTCSCLPTKPRGWSTESIDKLLSIDPNSVTEISGGY